MCSSDLIGPATPGAGYTVVLASDYSPGATTLNLAVRSVASGNSSSDSSIAVGGDIRRFLSNDATTTWVACTVNAYTADNGTLIGSWTTSTTQNTANVVAINGTLGTNIPANAVIYLIAQPYLLSVSASGIAANSIIRVAETAGDSPSYWHYTTEMNGIIATELSAQGTDFPETVALNLKLNGPL